MHLKLRVKDGSLREAMAEIVLPDTVGGDYLIKLREKASQDRERRTKARALSVQVHKLFNPLEEEISCKRVDSDGMLIDIAHLIDSKSIEKYQNRYSSAAKQLKNCELAISGPWPPYSSCRASCGWLRVTQERTSDLRPRTSAFLAEV